MVMMAVVERSVLVKVKVPAHPIVSSVGLNMISGELGVERGSVLLAIARCRLATVLGRLAALRGAGPARYARA